jgi:hypothetical protein
LAALSTVAGARVATAGGGIDGMGALSNCQNVGQLQAKPTLINGGTAATTLKAKSKFPKGVSGCGSSTGDAANVLSFQTKGSASLPTNDCFGLINPQVSNFTLTIKWKTAKGTPKLNPSTVAITNVSGTLSSTPSNHLELDLSGMVTSGSFSGETLSGAIVSDIDVGEALNACGAKGIKKVTFGIKPSVDDGQTGSATFSIN